MSLNDFQRFKWPQSEAMQPRKDHDHIIDLGDEYNSMVNSPRGGLSEIVRATERLLIEATGMPHRSMFSKPKCHVSLMNPIVAAGATAALEMRAERTMRPGRFGTELLYVGWGRYISKSGACFGEDELERLRKHNLLDFVISYTHRSAFDCNPADRFMASLKMPV